MTDHPVGDDRRALKATLGHPIAFYPALARLFGGVEAAVYWYQLYYWSDKGKRHDGFIYKTKVEIASETSLSIRVQDRVRKRLKAQGFLETKRQRANGAPTLHYQVKIDKVASVLKTTIGVVGMSPTGLLEQHKRGESVTETTTESTTIITSAEVIVVQPRDPRNADLQELIKFGQSQRFPLQGTNQYNRRAAWNLLRRYGLEPSKRLIGAAVRARGQPFAPVISDYGQLYRKAGDLASFINSQQQKKGTHVVIHT